MWRSSVHESTMNATMLYKDQYMLTLSPRVIDNRWGFNLLYFIMVIRNLFWLHYFLQILKRFIIIFNSIKTGNYCVSKLPVVQYPLLIYELTRKHFFNIFHFRISRKFEEMLSRYYMDIHAWFSSRKG